MTCIVALKHNGKIFMGADSASVGGLTLRLVKDPKIYEVGPFMFGFTSSWRMGQLLGHDFKPPAHDKKVGIEKFMATTFMNEVRRCLKEGGYSKIENGIEEGGTFIVTYKKRIFIVQNDFSIQEARKNYASVGCGEDIALGALYATSQTSWGAQSRIRNALSAAEEFSSGVKSPFLIKEHKPIKGIKND